jgi:PhnB protein
MAENAAGTYPAVTPYLYYEDVAAAMAWLAQAFGYRDRLRMTNDDGSIAHAEMERGDAVIMLGTPGPDYRNPKRLGTALGTRKATSGGSRSP